MKPTGKRSRKGPQSTNLTPGSIAPKPNGGLLSAKALENRKNIQLEVGTETEARPQLARLAVNPEATTARVLLDFTPSHGLDLDKVTAELTDIGGAIGRGDLSHVERLLTSQAQALNAIFVNLAERAQKQGPYLDPMQTLLGLALRAQNQCRATLETLANVKFPKSATFIRQANIAEQQQVNNGPPPPAREAVPIPSTELLEARSYETLRLDTATAGTGRRADLPLETLGAVHRPEKP